MKNINGKRKTESDIRIFKDWIFVDVGLPNVFFRHMTYWIADTNYFCHDDADDHAAPS
jgi:hypothetical protein